MIDKSYGHYTLSCDICGEKAPEVFYDFYDAIDYKKVHGWKSQRDKNGSWEEICPDCAKEGRDLEWD